MSDETCFVPDQHMEINFHGTRSLSLQTAGRHVSLHFILTPSKQATLWPYGLMFLSRLLIWRDQRLNFHTRGKNI